jgi:hypothetical protein
MRIYPSPVMNMKWKPHFVAGIGKPHRERFRACEVPTTCTHSYAHLPHQGLADAIHSGQTFAVVAGAE